MPTRSWMAGDELDDWIGMAAFDNPALLVRFIGVSPFLIDNDIRLSTTGSEGAEVVPSSEAKRLGDIANAEADSTAVKPTVFANLVPDDGGRACR